MAVVNITEIYAKYLNSVAQQKKGRISIEKRDPLQFLDESVNIEKKAINWPDTPEVKPMWDGRKMVSPRKVALKTSFGKITYKDIMFYRNMRTTKIIGDEEHTMTMEGCSCHKDYDIFPIKPETIKQFEISYSAMIKETHFRLQELTENAKIPCLLDNFDESDYTIVEL